MTRITDSLLQTGKCVLQMCTKRQRALFILRGANKIYKKKFKKSCRKCAGPAGRKSAHKPRCLPTAKMILQYDPGFGHFWIYGNQCVLHGYIQARNHEWVNQPFFAKYTIAVTWLDQLEPAFGENKFFFE